MIYHLFHFKIILLIIVIEEVWGAVQWLWWIQLLWFDFLFDYSDGDLILLLYLIRSDFPLHLVELRGIWNLNAITWRDDLIIEIIIVIESDSVLNEKVGLWAICLVHFDVRLVHYFELNWALNLQLRNFRLIHFADSLCGGLVFHTCRVICGPSHSKIVVSRS